VKIPDDAVIPDGKITHYLLVPKARDDKSQFLAKAGFSQNNPDLLKAAIRVLANHIEAIPDIQNEYGIFFLVIGEITGLDNRQLSVTTVWLQRAIDRKFQFITLKPYNEKKS
jgi:hypothetical protein